MKISKKQTLELVKALIEWKKQEKRDIPESIEALKRVNEENNPDKMLNAIILDLQMKDLLKIMENIGIELANQESQAVNEGFHNQTPLVFTSKDFHKWY